MPRLGELSTHWAGPLTVRARYLVQHSTAGGDGEYRPAGLSAVDRPVARRVALLVGEQLAQHRAVLRTRRPPAGETHLRSPVLWVITTEQSTLVQQVAGLAVQLAARLAGPERETTSLLDTDCTTGGSSSPQYSPGQSKQYLRCGYLRTEVQDCKIPISWPPVLVPWWRRRRAGQGTLTVSSTTSTTEPPAV